MVHAIRLTVWFARPPTLRAVQLGVSLCRTDLVCGPLSPPDSPLMERGGARGASHVLVGSSLGEVELEGFLHFSVTIQTEVNSLLTSARYSYCPPLPQPPPRQKASVLFSLQRSDPSAQVLLTQLGPCTRTSLLSALPSLGSIRAQTPSMYKSMCPILVSPIANVALTWAKWHLQRQILDKMLLPKYIIPKALLSVESRCRVRLRLPPSESLMAIIQTKNV